MSIIVAFDFDNTLVDTREIHRKAYEAVGVNPPDNWTGPWREWLPHEVGGSLEDAERVHMIKGIALNDLVRHFTPRTLPPAACYSFFRRQYTAIVLTGASAHSATRLWPDDLPAPQLFITDMTDDDKRDVLRGTHARVFVDDAPLRDAPCPVVWWTNQTAGTLRWQIADVLKSK